MKTYLGLLAALPFLLAGCESSGPKKPEPTCEGQTLSPVIIHTGPPELFVTPPTKDARRGKYLHFMVVASGTYTVTVSSPSAWLNFSAPTSSFPIDVCVPTDEPLGLVKYDVEIPQLGEYLDPHVKVVP